MTVSTLGSLVPAVAGFAIAVATAPAWKRRLLGPGWIDQPRPDRHARRPVPRVGGAAWLCGLLVGIGAGVAATMLGLRLGGASVATAIDPTALSPPLAPAFPTTLPPGPSLVPAAAGVIVVAALLAFGLGRRDDCGRIGPGRKWVLQALILLAGMVGLLVAAGAPTPDPGHRIDVRFAHAFTVTALPLLAAAALGLVLQVALEILDHLDGLLAVQAALGCAALALALESPWLRAASLAGGGASLGVLCWNRPPARVYFGNAGSLAVATVLPLLLFAAALPGSAAGASTIAGEMGGRIAPGLAPGASRGLPWRFLAVLPVFAWPLVDLATVTVARLRRGDPPWKGGRDHLAHRLAHRFGSDGPALAVAAAVAAAGFLLAATGLR